MLLGALSVAAVPAAVAASMWIDGVTLLRSLAAGVPAALVLALVSIFLRRRARKAIRRSVRPDERRLRAGKWLAWLGLYVGLMGGLALAFYGVLRWAE